MLATRPRRPWQCPACSADYELLGSPPEGPCDACLVRLEGERRLLRALERCAPEYRFEGAGVPRRFRGMHERGDWSPRFGRWPVALEAWEGQPSQVLLLGTEGTGKTGLATLLLLEHLGRTQEGVDTGEISSLWLSARDLVAGLEDAIAESRVGEGGAATLRYRELFRRARYAPFLVLDDLFAAGRTTPLAVEALAGVLTTRYDHELATVVTTNARPAQLKQALRSLGSRLLDGLVVALDGPDTRGPA